MSDPRPSACDEYTGHSAIGRLYDKDANVSGYGCHLCGQRFVPAELLERAARLLLELRDRIARDPNQMGAGPIHSAITTVLREAGVLPSPSPDSGPK